MDQILELLRLLEALPAAWDGLVQTIRELADAVLPAELNAWLADNTWAFWIVALILFVVLVVGVAGQLAGG